MAADDSSRLGGVSVGAGTIRRSPAKDRVAAVSVFSQFSPWSATVTKVDHPLGNVALQ